MAVRAIRGATTVEADTPEEVSTRTVELVAALLNQNGLSADSLISVLFSATSDIVSMAPATGLRGGLDVADVPLLCVGEMVVDGALTGCIRVLAHVETDIPRRELNHVFMRGATVLRPDLAGGESDD